MLVLCYGIPRSGSTLAFELVRGTLVNAGYPQDHITVENVAPTSRGVNFMRALERGRVSRQDSGDERHVGMTKASMTKVISEIGDRLIAVKTHEAFPRDLFAWLENLQTERKLQVIASYRDPRDICLSLLDEAADARTRGRFAFSGVADLEQAAVNVKKRLGAFQRWAALSGTLRLSYETTAFSPDDAIGAIEKILGVTVDHEAVKKYAFEDAFTQKNKGVRHRYLTDLPDAERSALTERFREFIEGTCQGHDEGWLSRFRDRMLRWSAANSSPSADI